MLLFFCATALICHQAKAQSSICDSIIVDSVYIDNNVLHITVFNSSQHFIVYPFFTTLLNSNSYIQLNDSVQVLSYLSTPGDANLGFSSANYAGSIATANQVPINTSFSGILTISDPNDSSFACSYPFNFLYGSMLTNLAEQNGNNFKLYPIPATNILTISASEISESFSYEMIDHSGRNVLNGSFSDIINKIDISALSSGIYFLKLYTTKPITSKIIISK